MGEPFENEKHAASNNSSTDNVSRQISVILESFFNSTKKLYVQQQTKQYENARSSNSTNKISCDNNDE